MAVAATSEQRSGSASAVGPCASPVQSETQMHARTRARRARMHALSCAHTRARSARAHAHTHTRTQGGAPLEHAGCAGP
eukprot:7616321-Alexandrium_andersonii.AAC.1